MYMGLGPASTYHEQFGVSEGRKKALAIFIYSSAH